MSHASKLKTNYLYSVKSKYIQIGGNFACALEFELKKNQWQMTKEDVDYFFKTMPFFLNLKPLVIRNSRIQLKERFYDKEVRLSMICYLDESALNMVCTVLKCQEALNYEQFKKNFMKIINAIDPEHIRSCEKIRDIFYRSFGKMKVMDLLGRRHWLVQMSETMIFYFNS